MGQDTSCLFVIFRFYDCLFDSPIQRCTVWHYKTPCGDNRCFLGRIRVKTFQRTKAIVHSRHIIVGIKHPLETVPDGVFLLHHIHALRSGVSVSSVAQSCALNFSLCISPPQLLTTIQHAQTSSVTFPKLVNIYKPKIVIHSAKLSLQLRECNTRR